MIFPILMPRNRFLALAKQIAATVTNPFDVIKTRRQAAADAGAKAASASSNRTFTLLRNIVKQEGYAGLFSGLTPRLAKVGSEETLRFVRPLLEASLKSLTRRMILVSSHLCTHRSDLPAV